MSHSTCKHKCKNIRSAEHHFKSCINSTYYTHTHVTLPSNMWSEKRCAQTCGKHGRRAFSLFFSWHYMELIKCSEGHTSFTSLSTDATLCSFFNKYWQITLWTPCCHLESRKKITFWQPIVVSTKKELVTQLANFYHFYTFCLDSDTADVCIHNYE